MACLTYHSNPELISLALDLLIAMDSWLHVNDDDRQGGLEEVLEDGILRGLVFAMDGKSDLIAVCSLT